MAAAPESAGRAVRAKGKCKTCKFTGVLDQEERCRACEEEAKAWKDTCKRCTRRVKDNEPGLECDNCTVWHHKKCERVDDDVYEMLKREKDMMWFCSTCNPKVRRNLKEVEKFKEENADMKKELNNLRKENGDMATKMEQLEEKWAEKECGMEKDQGEFKTELSKWKKMNDMLREKLELLEERVRRNEEDMVRRVTERVLENLEEREDREKRKKNVILFNVRESSKEEVRERETEDKEMCEYIFRDKLGVEGAQVEKVYRLGMRVRGKERPLVACLNEVYAKWEVIKRGKNLRDVEEEVNRIRVAVDKTRKEREEDAALKTQLQERRSQGGKWIIKKGKIVRLTEDQGTE